MSEDNLYAPPEANLEVKQSSSQGWDLAGRWARLGGVLVDSIVSLIILVPVMYLTGYWDRAMAGSVSFIEVAAYGVLGLLVYILVNGYLLSKRGQSIGKIAVGTKIVSNETNRILPLWKVIFVRYLPMAVLGQIPVIGGLIVIVDSLFIFRKDKRCVHDLIAGTKVVKAR